MTADTHKSWAVGLLVCLGFWVGPVAIQAQCNGGNIATSEGYTVRNVMVETLFGGEPPELRAALPSHRGEPYSASDEDIRLNNGRTEPGPSRDIYRREVQKFFSESNSEVNEDRRAGVNLQNSFYVRAKFLTDCVTIVAPEECQAALKDKNGQPVAKCVDVKIKIKVVPIHTGSVSANLLDLARSNKLRFYRELPAELRLFNPTFWIDQDRDFGTAAVLNSTVDLLELFAPQNEKANPARKTELRLAFAGRKSLSDRFYETTSTLTLTRSNAVRGLDSLGLKAGFSASEEPYGDGLRLENSFRLGGGLLARLANGPISQIAAGANYRRTNTRFYSQSGVLSEHTAENAFESRIVLDGQVARGFLRGALWFDSAAPEIKSSSYQRLVTTLGYAREFVLPHKRCRIAKVEGREFCEFPQRNAPILGVEMLLGAGHAWGEVPEYARFLGGNTAGNFLYDALNESAPVTMPDGPLIRSFGRNQAGIRVGPNLIRGGTDFWYYNLSMSLPLRTWSRPLIPPETVDPGEDETGHPACERCTSLKEALKNQVSGEKNIFIDALAVRELTPEQRDDLALDPDDGLTAGQQLKLEAANRAFEQARIKVTPQANRVWQRLTPAVDFIADHANLYAVKPLLMFDVAHLSVADGPKQRTRLGLGGGIQFNVVVAKFEVGYIRSVRRLPGDERGNFVVRMIFQKLF